MQAHELRDKYWGRSLAMPNDCGKALRYLDCRFISLPNSSQSWLRPTKTFLAHQSLQQARVRHRRVGAGVHHPCRRSPA